MAISRWFVRLPPSTASRSDPPPAAALSLLCSLMSPKYGDGEPPAQGMVFKEPYYGAEVTVPGATRPPTNCHS